MRPPTAAYGEMRVVRAKVNSIVPLASSPLAPRPVSSRSPRASTPTRSVICNANVPPTLGPDSRDPADTPPITLAEIACAGNGGGGWAAAGAAHRAVAIVTAAKRCVIDLPGQRIGEASGWRTQ